MDLKKFRLLVRNVTLHTNFCHEISSLEALSQSQGSPKVSCYLGTKLLILLVNDNNKYSSFGFRLYEGLEKV